MEFPSYTIKFLIVLYIGLLPIFFAALLKKNRLLITRILTLLVTFTFFAMALLSVQIYLLFLSMLLIVALWEISQKKYKMVFLFIPFGLIFFASLFSLDFSHSYLTTPTLLVFCLVCFKLSFRTLTSPPIHAFLAIFVIPFMVYCAYRIALFSPLYCLSLIVILQFSDNFAFAIGKKFGKHQIFPTLSPGKTFEGALGALFGATVGVLVVHSYMNAFMAFERYQLILLSIVSGIMAIVGDVFFSNIKRAFGIKDFSQILPGHGGVLDRFDNFLFSAPVLLWFLQFIY